MTEVVAGSSVFSNRRKACLTSAEKVMYPKNQRILNGREMFSGSVVSENPQLLPPDLF